MSKPNVRRSALLSLLALDRPIEDLRNELANFAWDDAPDLVKLTRDHIRVILQRFLAGHACRMELENLPAGTHPLTYGGGTLRQ